MKNNRKKVLIIIGSIVMLLGLIAAFTYAYFTYGVSTNELTLDVTIADGLDITFTAEAPNEAGVTVDVDGAMMLSNGIGEVAGSGETQIDITLDTSMDVMCMYDLYWVWDSGNSEDYVKTESDEKEFTISGVNQDTSFADIQLPNYDAIELKLGEFDIVANGSAKTQNWNFTVNFYNINANQDAHADMVYNGKVEVRNANCIKAPGDANVTVSTNGVLGKLPTENGYKAEVNCPGSTATFNVKYQRIEISDMNTKYAQCNINYVPDENINNYKNLKAEVERINPTYNDGYRYSGKEPNNWIWFNNEKWRIIGSVPTCTQATMADDGYTGTCTQTTEDAKPKLVKIIRAESIGGLAYHSANSNTLWGSGNTLYDLLNNYYYGKGNPTGASPCLGYSTSAFALCNYNQIGLSNDANDYYGKMIEEVYMNGGIVSSTSSKIDAAYDLEIGVVTKKTKIGLMTSSDYGYATGGITYSSIGLSSLSSHEQKNWLYGQYHERTMTPSSATHVMHVHYSGYVNNDAGAYLGFATRPVLYLDSSVYIIGGNGTITNPYIIGM